MQIVRHVFVIGVLALGGTQLGARAFVVAAQHIGITLVVEDLDRRPENAGGLFVGAVGEIEAAQAVVGGGKTQPGFRVVGMQLDRAPEMLLGETVIVGAILDLAAIEVVVGIAAEQARLGGLLLFSTNPLKFFRKI